MATARDHAVVIGASMAGLVAARVLSERFSSVTIIDRDDLPEDPSPRKGVPQGRHAHGLLTAGERVLTSLFPTIRDDLQAGGASYVNQSNDACWFWQGAYRIRHQSEWDGFFFTRPLLETAVRQRLLERPNVTLVRSSVQGLLGAKDAVRGVQLDGTSLPAELVIDCSGRSGQSRKWLDAIGAPFPEEVEVTMGMTYASRLLERRPDDPHAGDYIVTIPIAPESKRLGVCFPVEGNRWIVTLGSFFGETAPTDDAGYLAFAETLATHDIADVLRAATPVSDVVTHKLNSSRRRQVHKLSNPPAGYAMLGDTIASFNPIYGQGMSSAALQATALGAALDRAAGPCDGPFVRGYYKQAAKVVNNPWQITAGGDFSYPETQGKKAPGTDTINRYITKVQRATHTSTEVADAMLAVQNLVAPPPSLMKPAMMRKVLKAAKRSTPAPVRTPAGV